MPLFPAFINIDNKEILVVGGGDVARRKVESLLNFTRNITVVSPTVSEKLDEIIKEYKLKIEKRNFHESDLNGKFMVIVAVDDLNLQTNIFNLCQERGILCNSVDSPEFCNFIFPSLIVRGDIVIGISTSGQVPALSRRLREIIERHLPENIEDVLETIKRERKSMKKGRQRQELIIRLVEKLIPLE